MTTLKPGDEVRVFDSLTGRSIHEYPGEVVKVGRTLVTIAYGQERPFARTGVQFRMDTGRINDSYGDVWFKTMEEAARDKRAEVAEQVLKDAGLEIRLGRRPSPALLEALAAVAENFEERTGENCDG